MMDIGGGRRRSRKPTAEGIRAPRPVPEPERKSLNTSKAQMEGVTIREAEENQDVVPALLEEEIPEALREEAGTEDDGSTEEADEEWDGRDDGEPLSDEDESPAEDDGEAADQWDPDGYPATDLDGNPQDLPAAAIIINEFGEVIVPRETYLRESSAYAFTDAGEKIRRGSKRIGLLKVAGQAIVAHNRDLLLHGPEDFSEVQLRKLTQISVFENITNAPNSSSLVTGNYVRTPLWGIVPLSSFFHPDEWATTMETAWKILHVPEDVRAPITQEALWELLARSREHLLQLRDPKKRMLRLKLHEYGIPLRQGRRVVNECVRQWALRRLKADKARSVCSGDIPGIREEILKSAKFDTEHTRVYRQTRYRRFIEQRIAMILGMERFTIT